MRSKRLALLGLALAITATVLYTGADVVDSDRMAAASQPFLWGAAYALGAAQEAWRHARQNDAHPSGGGVR